MLTALPYQPQSSHPQPRSGMLDLNIAVIGSAGVGKSTFIQGSLGLQNIPATATSSVRISLNNAPYTVSLIELGLESFNMLPGRQIHWPKQADGHVVPRIDGAFVLYDVMDKESAGEVPQILGESRLASFL